jgi:SAM-dependent methyltransferase
MTPQEHWNAIYRTKSERDVSWFEALPAVSLELLEDAGLTEDTCVVDVGGGESRLVDALLARGLDCLAVLDVSGEALDHARTRVGSNARVVTWIEADVTAGWSLKAMDIWHDRAVFHFLVAPDDRIRYLTHMRETLKPGGSAIIATFAPDGPATCSGLPVARYSPATLAQAVGRDFELVDVRAWQHVTPWGALQPFQYSRFRRLS